MKQCYICGKRKIVVSTFYGVFGYPINICDDCTEKDHLISHYELNKHYMQKEKDGVYIENKKTLRSPDKKKIYHVWHFCNVCKETFDHSQGDNERIKNHVHFEYGFEHLRNVSTQMEFLYY